VNTVLVQRLRDAADRHRMFPDTPTKTTVYFGSSSLVGFVGAVEDAVVNLVDADGNDTGCIDLAAVTAVA
jgi:hypothetical protein